MWFYWCFVESTYQSSKKLLHANRSLECRGPDKKVDLKGNINQFNKNINLDFSFVFNRLSIIDLSDQASQPMYSEQFNTSIMFNGEIFNHKELRSKLENKKLFLKQTTQIQNYFLMACLLRV